MNKRMVFLSAVGFILASFYPVKAQQPTKVRKIGFLDQTGAFTANVESFRQGMRELGYIEGQNIVIEYRSGEQGARLTELANELVQQKVEVIVTSGPAARPAKMATETIPIVFNFSGDPVEAGFIDSLARPGRNMTGVTQLAFELVGKRLEILKEAVPGVSRVAVLASPLHAGEQRELRETQSTARVLGIILQYNQVRDTAEVGAAFDTIIKEKANALVVFPDPVTNANHTQITEFAVKRHLPACSGAKNLSRLVGLCPMAQVSMSYTGEFPCMSIRFSKASSLQTFRRAADEVRVSRQLENCQANRPDHSTERVGEGGQGDSVAWSHQKSSV